MRKHWFGGALAAAMMALPAAAFAREAIHIVGSSTVYPFVTVVAERFGRSTPFRTPRIESTGSGGGFKLFCAGVGAAHPDIVNASRRIKPSELARCRANGVNEIVEIKIGYDGIAVANSRRAPRFDLSRKALFLALARQVPDPADPGSGRLVPNPYETWRQVDPSLPDVRIEVLGPPPTSGTRDAFAELAMEGGCRRFGWIAALKQQDGKRYRAICHAIREDGAYVEAGENDNLIVRKLEADPGLLGLFGYSYLERNLDRIQGARVDGVAPGFEEIAEGRYPVSRPLYVYVKKAHVGRIPGLRAFLAELASERAWGEDGYLVDRGLIPMPEAERRAFAQAAEALTPLELEAAE